MLEIRQDALERGLAGGAQQDGLQASTALTRERVEGSPIGGLDFEGSLVVLGSSLGDGARGLSDSITDTEAGAQYEARRPAVARERCARSQGRSRSQGRNAGLVTPQALAGEVDRIEERRAAARRHALQGLFGLLPVGVESGELGRAFAGGPNRKP